MALRLVIDGISVEADSAQEVATLIKTMGKGSATPKQSPSEPAYHPKDPGMSQTPKSENSVSEWSPGAVQRLSMKLSTSGRELLKLLLRNERPTSTREMVEALHLTDIRGTGAMISSFRKTVIQLGLTDPMVITPRSETKEKATLVDLVPAFRRAAAEARIV